MNCPKCKTAFDEPMEECNSKIINSGKGYNWEFGQPEYWFEAELTCPQCKHQWDISDSSL